MQTFKRSSINHVPSPGSSYVSVIKTNSDRMEVLLQDITTRLVSQVQPQVLSHLSPSSGPWKARYTPMGNSAHINSGHVNTLVKCEFHF